MNPRKNPAPPRDKLWPGNLADPQTGLRPGEAWVVGGLDWSWTFVWFRDIPGCPGYVAGSNGTFWSYHANGNSRVKWLPAPRLRKTTRKGTVYDGTKLVGADGTQIDVFVHRTVNTLFNGVAPPGKECCHNDGDKRNNHFWNLRWATRLDNARDRSLKHGTQMRGEAHHLTHLTASDIPKIYDLYIAGMSPTAIGRQYDVKFATIARIVRGETWTCAAPDRIPPALAQNTPKELERIIELRQSCGALLPVQMPTCVTLNRQNGLRPARRGSA